MEDELASSDDGEGVYDVKLLSVVCDEGWM